MCTFDSPWEEPLGSHFLLPSSYTMTEALAATIECSLQHTTTSISSDICYVMLDLTPVGTGYEIIEKREIRYNLFQALHP